MLLVCLHFWITEGSGRAEWMPLAVCFIVSPSHHAAASLVSSFTSRVPSGTVHPPCLTNRSPVAVCRWVTVGRTLTPSDIVVNLKKPGKYLILLSGHWLLDCCFFSSSESAALAWSHIQGVSEWGIPQQHQFSCVFTVPFWKRVMWSPGSSSFSYSAELFITCQKW